MAREAIKLGKPVKHGTGIRWTRMVDGERWLSKTYPHETRENKREAWQSFVSWREALAARPQPFVEDNLTLIRQVVTQKAQAMLSHAELTANPREAGVWRKVLEQVPDMDEATLFRMTALLVGEFDDVDHTPVIEDRERTAARIRAVTDPDLTARKLADDYLQRMLKKVEGERASHGNYGQAKAALDLFVTFYGPSRSLGHFNEQSVQDFTDHLEALIEGGTLARNSANRYQQQFRTWITTIAETHPDDITVPVNLYSKRQLVAKGRKEPVEFTKEEVKLLLQHAVPRTRLFLLLMLNCGMYQGDISDLKATEIDWQAGRIIRPRSKVERLAETKGHRQPVKVNWLLWRETWKLFQEYAATEGSCFRSETGGALITEKSSTRNDVIRSAYSRLIAKLKRHELLPATWHKTLKSFRKTGANILEKAENPDHAQFYNLYLSSSVAKASYLTSGERVPSFDQAVIWLGKEVGVK